MAKNNFPFVKSYSDHDLNRFFLRSVFGRRELVIEGYDEKDGKHLASVPVKADSKMTLNATKNAIEEAYNKLVNFGHYPYIKLAIVDVDKDKAETLAVTLGEVEQEE